MIYERELFPQWRGDLFLGALVDMELRRIEMNNGEPGADTPVFPDISARIRDIRQAPDGSIYVLTDGTAEQPGGGAILRVVPATSGS